MAEVMQAVSMIVVVGFVWLCNFLVKVVVTLVMQVVLIVMAAFV